MATVGHSVSPGEPGHVGRSLERSAPRTVSTVASGRTVGPRRRGRRSSHSGKTAPSLSQGIGLARVAPIDSPWELQKLASVGLPFVDSALLGERAQPTLDYIVGL